jgi:hypothetical protein
VSATLPFEAMGSLLKSCITLVIIAVIAYLVFFVSFGDKTLYQHVVGISETKEAKILGTEVGKKYKKTKKKVTREIKGQINEFTADEKKSSSKTSSRGTPNNDGDDDGPEEKTQKAEHTDNDRRALKRLFKQKLQGVENN